ncbi:ankyrin repeat-containing domain protein [Russula ochroleuca]|uniref:Ankyrin repeat-containing domain protein n=1 Tax=Russula ochroleuca TaxID=152965 RepID=A0A9P5MMF4_9AGAM|nr:ankyrin repeat-containing domain protein [Russula ochroleuca]
MMAVRNLEVTHHVDGVVHSVDGNVKATKMLTEDIDVNMKATMVLTEDIDDNIKATKAHIHDVVSDIKATKVLVEDINDNVKGIEGVARSVNNATHGLKRNQIQEKLQLWLSPPDPSVNHNTACKTQHSGTAMWFIQGSTFQDWKKNGSLLWIRGNPGAGKSILCSTIIEDIKSMREASSVLIAYHYFDFKDASKRDLRGLLASLLFQLCNESDHCRDVLYNLYTSCHNGSEQPSDAALARCLRNMLELPGQLPTFLIIDALDECPNTTGTPSAREEVLDFLEDLVGSSFSNLFICITSRPEQDIQSVLNPLTCPSRRVSLHEEGGQREDIKSYVYSFVHKDRAMRRWREEDRNLVITTLIERAGGMFRWALCQLDTLRRCISSSIRKALNELPTTLDETYERALQEIPKEKRQHAHRLFQCLVVAIRPLRVEELAELFAIEFGADAGPNLKEGWRPENAEDEVLSACSTLIAIIENEGSKIVQFSHFSVKEFLTSDRLQTSEMGNIRHFHTPLDAAHTILARACLTVLLQLDENMDKKRLETFPLAFYAARHWVDHAKYEDVASRIQDAMEELFNPNKPYLAAWTWIHDMDSYQVREIIDDLEERPTRPEGTALYYAVLCGFSGLANYLIITHGENVNAECGKHGTPLHAASYKGHTDTARLLLAHGVDVNTTDESKRTSLRSADNGLDVMWLLREHGADVDSYYDEAGLLSHEASLRVRADVIHLLLQHDPEVKKYKRTPLCSAYDGGHLDAMRLLLEHGADVDVHYNKAGLLLHYASFCGQVDVIHLLIQHNADVNAGTDSNVTPLHAASMRGQARAAELLLEHEAIVNAQDKTHSTPLYNASEYGYLEVVQILLGHRADVDIRGRNDRTPVQVATSNGHVEVAQLLLEHGTEKG